jgi:outer membrane protein assembly factor BamB
MEAIDPVSAKAKWRVPIMGQMPGSAMLATGGGLLFTGKHSGEFLAVDADSGEQLWQFKTPSPPFVGHGYCSSTLQKTPSTRSSRSSTSLSDPNHTSCIRSRSCGLQQVGE